MYGKWVIHVVMEMFSRSNALTIATYDCDFCFACVCCSLKVCVCSNVCVFVVSASVLLPSPNTLWITYESFIPQGP